MVCSDRRRRGDKIQNSKYSMAARDAFLNHLIDYAGLFPPAALDLETSMANYLSYRRTDDAWMLERFVIPAAQLGDALKLVEDKDGEAPIHFSVLGVKGREMAGVVEETASLAAEVEAARPGSVTCDRFEFRLPLISDYSEILGDVVRSLEDYAAEREGIAASLEVPLTSHETPDSVAALADAIRSHEGADSALALTLKFRCGGVTPELYPEPEVLAHVVRTAIDFGMPFKGTAGLHHPFRTPDPTTGKTMYGFLNVFGGAILAREHDIDADGLAEILVDDNPSHFGLADELSWTSFSVYGGGVHAARRDLALSFGSCSFDEPREDLRENGWL